MSLPILLYPLLALTLYHLLLKPLLNPLRHIPGPFLARLTRAHYLHALSTARFEKHNRALHRTYGPVVRLAPDVYSFSTREAVDKIYGKGTEFDKSAWYAAWNPPGFKTLFTEPSVRAHGVLRRKFAAAYAMSAVVGYEARVEGCIDVFLHKLREVVAGTRGEVDMARWLLCYAADTVAEMTYSRRLGVIESGGDVDGFLEALHGNLRYSTLMGVYAEWHPAVFQVSSWLEKLGLGAGTARMSLARFSGERIAEKKREREAGEEKKTDEAGSRDFLTKFLDAHDADPEKFTPHDVNIGLISNIIAGSDTTAAALAATLYCLVANPSTLSTLRKEIAAYTASGQLSSPPKFKEAQQMPYLQAVFQESQRLYPGAALPLQRVVPASGAELSGYYFPPGTVVGVNAAVIHQDTSIFGPDASSFRPERWLEAEGEGLRTMQRYWMPFGLGSRTCIGKNISLVEMTKLVPELVKRFDFELGEGLRAGQEWEWVNFWLTRPRELRMRVRVRVDG